METWQIILAIFIVILSIILPIYYSRKKNAEERIKQLKNQAMKDIKNASVKISIESVEKLIKNSLDKSKLDKIYSSSIEETKLALKKKSS